MRGYPKTVNSKRDYENLMSISEYASHAKSDLALISSVDDSVIFVDVGTSAKPSLKAIANPSPSFKRLGYKDRASMIAMSIDENIKESK